MNSPGFNEVRPGERIGRYTVLRRLATGGMAEIYLARHDGPKGFAKLVVIKRVLPGFSKTEKFVEMFLDESRLAARLSHPNIAQTFELGEHEGRFHIAMEYVAGESLARMVKHAMLEKRTVPAGSVLRLGMQLLEALDYAHELKGEKGEWLKVVHRDVSPTNVIITYHGGVKLLDFGIARAASHEHQTQTGTVKGKGGYMSPEQAVAGEVDQRTDVYAAGALLYLLTTGTGPFDDAGNVFAMMQAAVDARFPTPRERNPQVNVELEKIILKAMATRPDDRFDSAGAMLTELEGYAASQRIYPGPRELATFMRQLFPDRAELARSYDQAPDPAIVAKLAESFNEDVEESREVIGLPAPTRLARRPPEVPAVASKPAPLDLDRGSVPTVPLRQLPGRGRDKPLSSPPVRPSKPVAALGESEEATMQVPSMFDGVQTVGSRAPTEDAVQMVGTQDVEPREHEDEPGYEQALITEGRIVSEQPEPRTVGSAFDVGAVADLVSKNPVAFVLAGLAAVVLAVLVLWLLS
jgi:serine/threonine protein kinase